jgi:hypothetical protein
MPLVKAQRKKKRDCPYLAMALMRVLSHRRRGLIAGAGLLFLSQALAFGCRRIWLENGKAGLADLL